MRTLKIEMVHDLVCSWCHIGYHNISTALERLAGCVVAEFYYLPFELNPGLGPQGVDITEHLCQRNRWTLSEAEAYRERLLKKAGEVGVKIDFSKRTRYYNTSAAHRLLQAAEKAGLQRQMHRALLQAYHVEGKNIGDPDILRGIASNVGLDDKAIVQVWTSGSIDRRIRAPSDRARRYDVRTVPAFIFEGQRFVSGSNSSGYFERLIRREFLAEARTGSGNREEATCPTSISG